MSVTWYIVFISFKTDLLKTLIVFKGYIDTESLLNMMPFYGKIQMNYNENYLCF